MSAEPTRPNRSSASRDAHPAPGPARGDESARELLEKEADRDQELLRRMSGGDEMALEVVVREHQAMLQGYVRKITGTPESAEEIVQDAFVRLWGNRAGWRPRSSIKAILHRIARNLAVNYCRDRKRRCEIVQEHAPRPPRPPTPDELMEAKELAEAIDECLAELPRRRAQMVKLRYLEGRPAAEVGRMLGLSPQTVANQASIGRRELAEKLQARVVLPPMFRA